MVNRMINGDTAELRRCSRRPPLHHRYVLLLRVQWPRLERQTAAQLAQSRAHLAEWFSPAGQRGALCTIVRAKVNEWPR
jgi:hypothetical protein